MTQGGKLSALKVAKATKRGMYGDGAGLWLRVASPGVRSWSFRYQIARRVREMGLGPLHSVSLAEARERVAKYRKQLLDGIDPMEARDAERAHAKLAARRSMTFRQAAEIYIEAHRPSWRSTKHASQWEATLATYAHPVCGDISVQEIDLPIVMRVLEPLWRSKTETASRLRGRIEAVLDWAKVRGYRQGENPARWRGHLENLLPARAKVRRVQHHPALPYAELGAFMVELRKQESVAARALEFAILTAARTGEVLGARFDEIDPARIWVIKPERMKGLRQHRVPLSDPALAIVEQARALAVGDLIFPGRKRDTPLSGPSMPHVLERMGRKDISVHGFRSTFADWASEQSAYPNEVVEMALAHAIASAVEAAYRRGDLFEKRRRLMDDWARFCEAPAADGHVVAMRRASE
jgi:integrase